MHAFTVIPVLAHVGKITGTSTLVGVGADNSSGAGVGSITGTSTLTGVLRATIPATGNIVGTATLIGHGVDASPGAMAGTIMGTSALTGVGASNQGTGTIASTATFSGVGAAIYSGVGSIAGTATVAGVGSTVSSPIAPIAHTIAQTTDTSNVTTPSIDTTGADFIVIAATINNNTTQLPTDNKGNTYVGLTVQTNSNVSTRMYYCLNPTVGAGHTFSFNLASCFVGMAVAAFSNVVTSSGLDVQNGANTGGATSLQTGSVTPSQNNELIVYATGDARTTTVSVDVGTITDQRALVGGTAFAIAMAYEIQTTAVTRNPTWSWSGSARTEAVIATFKQA